MPNVTRNWAWMASASGWRLLPSARARCTARSHSSRRQAPARPSSSLCQRGHRNVPPEISGCPCGCWAVRRSTNRRHGVGRRVVLPRLVKGVAPFAALAALPAMQTVLWIHTGEGQLERHAQGDAEADHVALLHRDERRVDGELLRKPERERAGHGREELRRGIGKWIAGERAQGKARDAMLRAVDASLAQ